MWSIRTLEYYSAMKWNEILVHAKIWMNLEDITLSEIAGHRRTNIFHLYKVSRIGKYIERQ